MSKHMNLPPANADAQNWQQGTPPQGQPPQGQPPQGQPPQGPGQYWTPGQYPPPPQKPKKKWYQRVWFWILAVVVVIVVANCAGGGGGDSDSANSSGNSSSAAGGAKPAAKDKPAAKKAPAMATIGDAVTSGHFKFTVTNVQKGISLIGDSDFGEKAQGQFVFVSVKVTNVGDSSEMFMGSDQKLFDRAGKEYSADDDAAMYLDDSNSFLEDINPGNTVTGKIVFDVPKTVTPKYIEFSGALFSSSVKVALT